MCWRSIPPMRERVVHHLQFDKPSSERRRGVLGMWNILEQILLLGGAIGSMAGGIVAIVTYLHNKKKK